MHTNCKVLVSPKFGRRRHERLSRLDKWRTPMESIHMTEELFMGKQDKKHVPNKDKAASRVHRFDNFGSI